MGSSNNDGNGGRTLMRVFVAIEMPEIVKEEIGRVQDVLRKHNLFQGTYVNPEHAHLTLQFVGYIEPVALAPIKKLLGSISFHPIQAKLGCVGTFGSEMVIKVIWLDVEGKGIVDLVHEIEKALSLGTVARKRAFQSHVTLARVKESSDVGELRETINEICVEPIPFTIDEFVLKQSTLTEQGPIYVDLEHYELG
ncbi:RNA 2',3'-cyclic phosphodiesterase [Candidatus Dependentiae bacterium]|nr:RNA 2',3'-cyclic phosphodiesterase [Candidatus Dependentiae bacterium]